MGNHFIDRIKTLGLQRNLPHIPQPLESNIHVLKHYESIDYLTSKIMNSFISLH